MASLVHGPSGAARRRVGDAVSVGAAGTYVMAAVASLFYALPGPVGALLLGGPALASAFALLHGGERSRTQGWALGAVVVTGTALLAGFIVSSHWQLAAAVPVVAMSALVTSRFPTLTLAAVACLTATYGSTHAFLGFPSQKAVDLLLVGLWAGAIWSWAMGASAGRRSQALWPGVVLVLVFVLLSAVEILAAENLTAAVQSFRASTWYLAVVVLLALAPWPDHVRPRLLRAVVVVALAGGAYASLRWVTGPAGAERAQAEFFLNNFLNEELRTVGSFFTAKELAAWSAMTIPFVTGVALVGHGKIRLVAAAAALACVIGMMAADVRAGPGAAVPAVVLVIALYQFAQAFRGRRGPAVAIAIMALGFAGVGAFALTLGGKEDSGRRYRAILDPTDDPSYQARVIKWKTAIEDIEEAPFGHGLGTSGQAQQRYGRIVNIASFDIDNAYLKIAHEQGFAVLALFALAMLLVFVGLVRRAMVSLDPARAGPAIAAAGTLAAMLILFHVGSYIEGLPALWGWLLVGLGVSLSSGRTTPTDTAAGSAALHEGRRDPVAQ